MHQQEQKKESSLFQLHLDAANSYMLRSAASWAKVLAVAGIILGIFFGLIGVIAAGEAGSRRNSRNEGIGSFFGPGGETILGAVILLITAAVFILGGIFSWQFGKRIGAALQSNDQAGLDRGFTALRNYYALRSLVLVIVLLLFLISIANAL